MNKHKNRILLLIMFSLTVYFFSLSQTQSPDSNSLKEGVWALQFGIGGNFTLTTFQGATIGAMYRLSDKNAVRGGITINGSTNDGTTSNSGSISDTSDGPASGKQLIENSNRFLGSPIYVVYESKCSYSFLYRSWSIGFIQLLQFFYK